MLISNIYSSLLFHNSDSLIFLSSSNFIFPMSFCTLSLCIWMKTVGRNCATAWRVHCLGISSTKEADLFLIHSHSSAQDKEWVQIICQAVTWTLLAQFTTETLFPCEISWARLLPLAFLLTFWSSKSPTGWPNSSSYSTKSKVLPHDFWK